MRNRWKLCQIREYGTYSYTYVLDIVVYNLKLCQIQIAAVKYAILIVLPGVFWIKLRDLRIGLRGRGKNQCAGLDLGADCGIRIDHLNVDLLGVAFRCACFRNILQTIVFSRSIFELLFEIRGLWVIFNSMRDIEVLRAVLAQMNPTVESLGNLLFHF